MNLEMVQKLKREASVENVVEEVKKPVVVDVVGEVKRPFCDQCDSKGVRHKKECLTLAK